MGKTYEIAFRLAGQISGQFSKSFKAAGKTISGMGSELNELNKQASDIGKLVRLRKEVGESARDYIKAKQEVERLGKELRQTEKPTKQQATNFDKAQKAATKAKNAFEKKRESLRSLDKTMGTAGTSLRELVNREKALEKQAEKARQAQERLAKANERISRLDSIKDKVGGAAGKTMTQAAVAGASIGAAGYGVLKLGSDNQAAMNQLQAQTGASGKEMEALRASARSLYRDGLGESMAEISAAMANVRQMTGLTGEALKGVTKNGLMLKDVFGFEVNESTRAASALMKNFGIDGSEAYALIAKSAQLGADKNGDLLDTFNEYSVHFKALGFSAGQFGQILVEGAKNGSWSIDKVGDAMKEFTIRTKDGSKKTLTAFKDLGLNGKTMTKMFAKGGEDAQKATWKVIEALNGIKDPVEKNRIGVELFGTMFEDLEAGVLDTFLAAKKGGLETKGVLEDIAKTRYNDLFSQVKKISRSFTDSLSPAAEKATEKIKAKMPEINAAMGRLTPVLSKAIEGFAAYLPGIIDGLTGIASTAASVASTIASNWGTIGPIVKGVAGAFLAFKGLTVLAAPFLTVASWAMKAHKALLLAKNSTLLHTAATKAAAIAQRGLSLAMSAFSGPIGLIVVGIAAAVAAGVALYKNWDKVKAKCQELWAAFSEKFPAIAGILSSAFEKMKSMIGTLKEAFGGLKEFVSGIFSSLAGIIKNKINSVISVVNGAIGKLNSALSFDIPFSDKKVSLNIPKIPQLAKGGIVTKPTIVEAGEGREAEAITPLSKLESMINAGRGGESNFTFSPVINITGSGGDAYADIKRGLEEGQRQFRREFEKLMANKNRLSYA